MSNTAVVLKNALKACFITVGSSSLKVQEYPARGPNQEYLGHHHSFHENNVGFFVNEKGLFWSYYTGGCQCQAEGNDYHLVPDDRAKPSTIGRSLITMKTHAVPSHLAVGVANKPSPNFLPLSQTAPAAGQRVFAIGHRDDHMIVTQGKIERIEPGSENSGIGHIVCSLQVYHGFCGGPLITHDGKLIGFGASHGGSSDSDNAYRRFDIGSFESASDLVTKQNKIISPHALANVCKHQILKMAR